MTSVTNQPDESTGNGVTDEQHRQHLIAGAESCLVCDSSPIGGSWTDYNGQIRCRVCGMTYQVLGSHLTDEALRAFNLTKQQIARRYCDAFEIWPICRDYFQETRQPVPLGMFIGARDRPGPPKEEFDRFYEWLGARADRYEPHFPLDFKWDKLRVLASKGDSNAK